MTTVESSEIVMGDKLKPFVGQWVAIQRDCVVAHAPTLKALREQVIETEYEGILRVPPQRRGGVFL